MQQIALYRSGERDYTLLKGSTGPLVYPAAHVYIYSWLSWVTDAGREIGRAQWVFGGVYVGALGVVMGAYQMVGVGGIYFFRGGGGGEFGLHGGEGV